MTQPHTPWRQHALIQAVFFLMGAELFLASPLLPTISGDFGTSIAATAWVVTVFGLSYAIASPLVGALTEHLPRRRVILSGIAVFATGELLCALAPGLGWLLAARAIGGIGGALVGPAMWAYLAETAAPHERGRAIARGSAAYAGGQIVGVPLATFAAAGSSWRFAFAAVALGLVAAGTLIALRLRESVRATASSGRPLSALRSSFGLWKVGVFRTIMAGNFFVQAARLGTYAYAGALFATKFGFETGVLGLVGMVVGIGSLIGSMVSGPLIDRWSSAGRHVSELSVGWGLVLAVALGVAATAETWQVCVAGFVLAFFCGTAFFSTAQVYLTTVMAERRAPAVSWNNSVLYIGTGAGTTVLGLTTLGGTAFAVCSVAFALLAAGFSALSALRRPSPAD
ncbi:sugar (and other) transporter family protein [Rhodococcus sp. MTM3W5.2]|uniref:MFS transporter n=1 Tax=Rhodococcus sp. MTM3W5.2 TaxID=1805827 RepID=UPI0009795FD6|nr:MFS transporter [Rhodococcus sp. MTM3W5.2]AQA25992.1 sugar (and other) transporter family protein [Rhodococcus sp. MTM3W5.2]